jgi:hypothetical protein
MILRILSFGREFVWRRFAASAKRVEQCKAGLRQQPQHVERYAEELAEHKAREARLEEESDDDEIDELPDDVPAKATITIKEINDNRYYYWQWREGEKAKSKYKPLVNPCELTDSCCFVFGKKSVGRYRTTLLCPHLQILFGRTFR